MESKTEDAEPLLMQDYTELTDDHLAEFHYNIFKEAIIKKNTNQISASARSISKFFPKYRDRLEQLAELAKSAYWFSVLVENYRESKILFPFCISIGNDREYFSCVEDYFPEYARADVKRFFEVFKEYYGNHEALKHLPFSVEREEIKIEEAKNKFEALSQITLSNRKSLDNLFPKIEAHYSKAETEFDSFLKQLQQENILWRYFSTCTHRNATPPKT